MILEAGRWAPSASNRQPWEFIIVKNKAKKQALAGTAIYGKFIGTAPIIIAIIGKVNQNPRWYIQDTSLVSMNMMLMAWALGIGTCWIGSMNRDKAREILELGKNDFVLTVLPMGYIEGEIPKPKSRKSLEKITKVV
jgi:nitroreductase